MTTPATIRARISRADAAALLVIADREDLPDLAHALAHPTPLQVDECVATQLPLATAAAWADDRAADAALRIMQAVRRATARATRPHGPTPASIDLAPSECRLLARRADQLVQQMPDTPDRRALMLVRDALQLIGTRVQGSHRLPVIVAQHEAALLAHACDASAEPNALGLADRIDTALDHAQDADSTLDTLR